MTVREKLTEMGLDDVVIFDTPSYDEAFVGLSEDNRAIYDFDKMVECLDMPAEEAIEFIEYNTIRALPYFAGAPIILYRVEE
jgi:hypothetical protein